MTKLVYKIQQQVSITNNLSKIYCIPGLKSKNFRFNPCEKAFFLKLKIADPEKTSTKIILMNISLNIKSNKLGHLIGEVYLALNVDCNRDF